MVRIDFLNEIFIFMVKFLCVILENDGRVGRNGEEEEKGGNAGNRPERDYSQMETFVINYVK